jgi:hypothetical protein
MRGLECGQTHVLRSYYARAAPRSVTMAPKNTPAKSFLGDLEAFQFAFWPEICTADRCCSGLHAAEIWRQSAQRLICYELFSIYAGICAPFFAYCACGLEVEQSEIV